MRPRHRAAEYTGAEMKRSVYTVRFNEAAA